MRGLLRLFVARARGVFIAQRAGRELEDEIEEHIRMLTERFVHQGMEREDAADAAKRQFGNAMVLRERHYEQNGFYVLTTLWRDLRFGARQLKRNPLLTAVAIVSLALGIGANTAVFVAAKRVLFDTLPVRSPDQLRMLVWVSGHEQPVPPVWGDVSQRQQPVRKHRVLRRAVPTNLEEHDVDRIA